MCEAGVGLPDVTRWWQHPTTQACRGVAGASTHLPAAPWCLDPPHCLPGRRRDLGETNEAFGLANPNFCTRAWPRGSQGEAADMAQPEGAAAVVSALNRLMKLAVGVGAGVSLLQTSLFTGARCARALRARRRLLAAHCACTHLLLLRACLCACLCACKRAHCKPTRPSLPPLAPPHSGRRRARRHLRPLPGSAG